MEPQRKYNKLQGSHILIIGGSSGIGYAVAEAAIESGAKVTISSSRPAKVAAAVASLEASYPGTKVMGFVADLSKPTVDQDLDLLFQQVTETTAATTATTTTITGTSGGIPLHHVLYTAADPLTLGPLEEISPEDIHRAAHMRMITPIMVGKVASRYLERTGATGPSSSSSSSSLILTTGSTAERPDKGWSAVTYFAAGLHGLTRALATDLAPLRVNAVAPGFVDTALWDGVVADMEKGGKNKEDLLDRLAGESILGRVGRVEDVAEAYLWLLKDSNVTGTIASTNSGQFLKK